MYPLLAAALLPTMLSVSASPVAEHPLKKRAVITPQEMLPSYDFVIAGGGLAGLVLASRLTEDPNTTVLVLESGDTGDAVLSRILTPTEAYFNGLLGSSYDWQYITAPQKNLNNRNLTWPRGKLLGGSSAVNGMYMVRSSALEMDTWAQMQGGAPGANAWGWDSMFAAMKMSEIFTPPTPEIQASAKILYDPASHGTSGPLHYSFPGYLPPIVGDWTATLDNIGVLTSPDANGGAGWGAFISTSSINPSNWTRSYAKTAYIDPLPPRSNLHIVVNQTVTRMIFQEGSSPLRASAVEYATSGYQPKPWPTVGVNKEVLLAGGAVGSPNILMQSGVGPQSILQAAGVPVVHALPGVGQHVQDHVSTQVVFKTNAITSGTLHASGASDPFTNGTGNPMQSFINNAIAYSNITDLLGDWAPTLKDEVAANITAFANDRNYNPSDDPTVTAGYVAIQNANNGMLLSQLGQVELLLSTTGTSQGGPGSFAVQAALQHAFSHGQLYIATNNPFDYPVIDPNYFSHPADIILLREGIKLARKIGNTAPLSNNNVEELWPGPSVQTDADWDNWLRQNIGTEYHPSCSCAMLPLDQGGVIDPTLKVYGLSNVRVVDTSIYPIEFAAHLMAPAYGVAEQAALILKAQYNGGAGPAALQTASINPTTRSATETTARPTGTLSGGDNQQNAASHALPLSTSSIVSAAIFLVALIAL